MLFVVASVVLVVILILIIVFPYQFHGPSFWRKVRRLPGPEIIPIVGSKFIIGTKNDQFLQTILELTNRYPDIYRIEILGTVMVMISNVDAAEIIMGTKAHITKSLDYELLKPWLGTGLLTSTGDKWFKHRKLLTPTFHFGILEQYIEIFTRNTKVLNEKIASYGDRPIEINQLISLCTLDIICETAMGTQVFAQSGGEQQYVKDVLEMSRLFQIRQLSPWLYRELFFELYPTGRLQKKVLKRLHDFTKKVIREKRELFLSKSNANDYEDSDLLGGKKRKSFLELLIEISEVDNQLSEEDIREEVDTFMFEGHDTTSAAISWALFELGLNPDIQDRVKEELDEIFGKSDREATHSDLAEMKYLERVIKETLRLYPSVPLVARGLTEDVVLNGYEVPAGTNAAIIIFYIHRDPKLYPNPDKFDPDRFLPEKISKRHPYSYIPFSAGPRNCIGQKFAMMEEKTVLSQILRKYSVKSVTQRSELNIMAELVLRPKENLKMIFTPRND